MCSTRSDLLQYVMFRIVDRSRDPSFQCGLTLLPSQRDPGLFAAVALLTSDCKGRKAAQNPGERECGRRITSLTSSSSEDHTAQPIAQKEEDLTRSLLSSARSPISDSSHAAILTFFRSNQLPHLITSSPTSACPLLQILHKNVPLRNRCSLPTHIIHRQ